MIKSTLLRMMGRRNAGRLDYLLNRKSAHAWGPLNGQRIRQGVYEEITRRIELSAVVETGTFLGTTTEYFAKSGLPVYTVEIDPRCAAYAALRFRKRRNQVHAYGGNSTDFLGRLATNPDVPKGRVFFYLDAHVQDSSRYHKAPIVEELEIISQHWNESLVMIDDFQVPGTSYSFDDWGPGRNLSIDRLAPLKGLGMSAFFPAQDARMETGARRGWVVLCWEPHIRAVLSAMEALRPASLD
jgi:hypothetical protein